MNIRVGGTREDAPACYVPGGEGDTVTWIEWCLEEEWTLSAKDAMMMGVSGIDASLLVEEEEQSTRLDYDRPPDPPRQVHVFRTLHFSRRHRLSLSSRSPLADTVRGSLALVNGTVGSPAQQRASLADLGQKKTRTRANSFIGLKTGKKYLRAFERRIGARSDCSQRNAGRRGQDFGGHGAPDCESKEVVQY
ncbi:hypothetical protein B0H13DRAFT_1886214 [Mycena leptocephala]|nr:hypothetical protein B0H13DRAFT_1886214 [Mycena leptocephala]